MAVPQIGGIRWGGVKEAGIPEDALVPFVPLVVWVEDVFEMREDRELAERDVGRRFIGETKLPLLRADVAKTDVI